MAAKQSSERHVVVVARPAGSNWARVVQGVLTEQTEDRVTLKDARQALYYSRDAGGELGLATIGPGKESRVTGIVSRVELAGVGLIADCTEAAVTAWRDAPVYAGK